MAKKRIKKRRLFMLCAIVAGTIIAGDCIRRDYFSENDASIVVIGNFKSSQAQADYSVNTGLTDNNQPVSQGSTGISNLGYSETNIPASQLSSGLLAVYDAAHLSENAAGLVNLNDVKNDFYSVRNEDIVLASEAADALNKMMLEYNTATGLSDFIIYSTTQPSTGEDSACPISFAESASGFTVDLAIQGASRILEYDGLDEESWVIENCAKYGFIVRYPSDKVTATSQNGCVWHLRYVGNLHAAIMSENNLCLEEYVNWLKSYSLNATPLSYLSGGVQYEIYYTAYMGDITPLRVPVSGNYTISGNNIDGFIVSAVKK